MNKSQPRVAVIGSGLAAHLAAGVLAEAGIDVALHTGDAPGIFGIWNGLGSVFGPPSPPPSESAGAVEQRVPETRAFAPRREDRWTRLLQRRGQFHPYRRLGVGPSDVERAVDEASTYLPDGAVARIEDGTVVPGPHGHPAAPDLSFPSLLPLDLSAGDRIGLVRCAGVNGWDVDATVTQLDRAGELDASALESAMFEEAPSGHGVRVAAWLENRFDGDRDRVREAIADLADRRELDLLILPPVLGRTLDTHGELRRVIDEWIETDIAEYPSSRDPVFGWRLFRACRRSWKDSSIAVMPAAATVELTDRRAIALTDIDGDKYPCDAVVLATGRWFGGGLPGDAPLVERLTGAPIWLDGAPVTGDPSAYPPDYLGTLPWDDHALFRAGLRVDPSTRPLDRDGDPFDNVFAAGRLLAGFNPFHDGCSFGVELVTGLEAGRRAAEAVGDTSIPRDESDSLETS